MTSAARLDPGTSAPGGGWPAGRSRAVGLGAFWLLLVLGAGLMFWGAKSHAPWTMPLFGGEGNCPGPKWCPGPERDAALRGAWALWGGGLACWLLAIGLQVCRGRAFVGLWRVPPVWRVALATLVTMVAVCLGFFRAVMGFFESPLHGLTTLAVLVLAVAWILQLVLGHDGRWRALLVSYLAGAATVFGMPVLATVFAGNELDGSFIATMVVLQCLMVAVAALGVVRLGKSGSF